MVMVPGSLEDKGIPSIRIQGGNAIADVAQIAGQGLSAAKEESVNEAAQMDKAVATRTLGNLAQLKNDLFYGPDGAASKLGENALNLTANYMPAFKKGAEDLTKDLTPIQQGMVAPHITNEGTEFKALLTRHQEDQRRKFYDQTSESLIGNLEQDARANFLAAPDKVDLNIKSMMGEIGQIGKRNGWSQPEMIEKGRKVIDSVHAGIIGDLLKSGLYPKAQAYYDARKDQMTEAAKDSILPHLQESETQYLGEKVWNQLKGIRMADGKPDVGAMMDRVYGMKNLTPVQREKIAQQVSSRGRDMIRVINERDDATVEGFKNDIYKMRQPGPDGQPQGTLEDAFRIAASRGKDVTQIALLEKVASEIFAPGNVQSDPATYTSFLDQAHNGTIDTTALDQAFQGGKLSLHDYRQLGGKNTSVLSKGVLADDKFTEGAIKKMASDNFTNPTEKADFLRYVEGSGKTGKDKQDFAEALLKQAGKDNPYSKLDLDWKASAAKQNASTATWKALNQRFGTDMVNAMGNGFLATRPKGSKWSGQDVLDLMNTFGGPEFFDRNQPGYLAVKALRDHGYAVNQDTIHRYLNRYPQGAPQQ